MITMNNANCVAMVRAAIHAHASDFLGKASRQPSDTKYEIVTAIGAMKSRLNGEQSEINPIAIGLWRNIIEAYNKCLPVSRPEVKAEIIRVLDRLKELLSPSQKEKVGIDYALAKDENKKNEEVVKKAEKKTRKKKSDKEDGNNV